MIITKTRLRQIVLEETNVVLREKKKEKNNEKEDDKEKETTWLNIAFDILGFVPVVGEVFDLYNAVDYAKKGKYLFSAFSLISVIPEVGDIVGKGGKIGVWISSKFPKFAQFARTAGPTIGKVTKPAKKAKAVSAGIKAAKKVIGPNKSDKLTSKMKKHKSKLDKAFDAMKDDEKIGEYIPEIKKAFNDFLDGKYDGPEVSKVEA